MVRAKDKLAPRSRPATANPRGATAAKGKAAGKHGAGRSTARVAGKAASKAEPKRRIRLDTDERRAQLLELARRVFTERAYDDVSIDDTAAAAGISKGLLYHYFPTKRDLYVAGLRATSRELVSAVSAAIDDSQPPVERVRAALDAYLQHVTAVGVAFVALMRGGVGSDPEVADVVESTRRAFLDQFLQRSPIAALFATEPLVRLAVRGWIGMVEATSIEWVSQPTVPRAAVRDLLVENLTAVLMKVRTLSDLR
jgi:AcrR family transcriptional regulator